MIRAIDGFSMVHRNQKMIQKYLPPLAVAFFMIMQIFMAFPENGWLLLHRDTAILLVVIARNNCVQTGAFSGSVQILQFFWNFFYLPIDKIGKMCYNANNLPER